MKKKNMDLEEVFKHLVDTWDSQSAEYKKRNKYYGSMAVSGKRGISPETKKRLLIEAGYPHTPENWGLPKK